MIVLSNIEWQVWRIIVSFVENVLSHLRQLISCPTFRPESSFPDCKFETSVSDDESSGVMLTISESLPFVWLTGSVQLSSLVALDSKADLFRGCLSVTGISELLQRLKDGNLITTKTGLVKHGIELYDARVFFELHKCHKT